MSDDHKDSINTELPRLTPSSVSDLECPKKYRELRMGDGAGWGSNSREFPASVARSTATHDVLRQIYRTRRGCNVNIDHVEAYAKTAVWRGRFPHGVDRAVETQRVIAQTAAVVGNDTEEEISGTISVERPVEFDYYHNGEALMKVSSKIDRILIHPDEPTTLQLRDYKFTGHPKVSLPEAFIYLWSAKKAFSGQGFTNFELQYEFVSPENEITRETVTGADVRGQFALITEAAIRVIRGTDFPAVPGEACTYCKLRVACQGLPPENGTTGTEVF